MQRTEINALTKLFGNIYQYYQHLFAMLVVLLICWYAKMYYQC